MMRCLNSKSLSRSRIVPWLALILCFRGFVVSKTITVSCICNNSSSQCQTLDQALAMVESDTELVLESGEHTLQNFSLIQDVQNITLKGSSTSDATEVRITCFSGVGLGAVNVTNLQVSYLTIYGCGLSGANLDNVTASVNQFVDLFYQIPSEVKVAIFLAHCRDIIMKNVVVTGTAGIGLLAINVIGNSSLVEMQFVENSNWEVCSPDVRLLINNSKLGGGAYFLYQDYRPDYASEYTSAYNRLVLDESKFTSNSVCSFEGIGQYYSLSRSLRNFGYAVGFGGAGLSIVLGQSKFAVSIQITASEFKSNMALVAGAAYIGIFTYVRNSSVSFSSCTFDSNTAWYIAGGIGLINDLDRYDASEITEQGTNKSIIEITDSTFKNCSASAGGGAIYLLSTRFAAKRIVSGSVRVRLAGSFLRGNIASGGGAAIECRETLADGRHLGMQLEISDTVINESNAGNTTGLRLINRNIPAAVSVYQMQVTLSRNTYIGDNSITGLFAYGALIGIDGSISLVRNFGTYGGGMNLQGLSFLIITNSSSLQMISNTARALGGAIYIDQGSTESLEQCFLYFGYDQFVYCTDCSNLNNTGAQIVFAGNTARRGNDIYGSSTLAMCPWAWNYSSNASYVRLSQLFPTVFNFSNKALNGTKDVEGLTNLMTIQNESFEQSPGQAVALDIGIYDEYNQTRSDIISSWVVEYDYTCNYNFLLNGQTVLSTNEDDSKVYVTLLADEDTPRCISLQIYSITQRLVSQTISVEVRKCPAGFEFDKSSRRCQCMKLLNATGVTCYVSSLEFEVPHNTWLGYVESSLTVLHTCPSPYCRFNFNVSAPIRIPVKNNTFDMQLQCSSVLNRGGIGCRTCKAGYSEMFGISSTCMQCTNDLTVIPLVLTLIAGVLLTWTIAYFRLTVSQGYIYGILLYCNILSVHASHLTTWNPRYALLISSWLTLNIGVDICFYNGMTSVGRVGFGFVFPTYLFSILLIITIISRFDKPSCCKRNKCSCSVVHFSTIQMFSTLLILCYTRVMETSVEALAPFVITDLYGNKTFRWFTDLEVRYFLDKGHGVIVAIGLIGIFYAVALPLFLLVPKLAYNQRFLRILKPIYDVLWEPFQPHLRCWLSIQLLFITVAFCLQFFVQPPHNIAVILTLLIVGLFAQSTFKPYKHDWVNTFNSLLLLDLIIIFFGALTSWVPAFQTTVHGFHSHDILTLVFVSVAYLSILAVMGYHMYQRCMCCRGLAARIKFTSKKAVKTRNVKPQANSYEMHNRVRLSDLREPMLED